MTGPDTTSGEIPDKREQILRGARATFGELGYERASVDRIAATAQCSKATIYNHFEDKRALFFACFSTESTEERAALAKLLDRTPVDNLEDELQAVGFVLLKILLMPGAVARFRIIAAEAERFPDLGRQMWRCGPEKGREMLAAYLSRAAAAGALRLDQPMEAAIDFEALLSGDLFRRALLGILDPPTEEELRAQARRAVRTFLRAYGP